ncbi:hypothetical protein V8J88_01035 [Massilia sp. W12]|uniref:hypothetical protein n=1 Tax=Massilia sp. W12 TaxID=3126507 RepID=UPI0030CAC949
MQTWLHSFLFEDVTDPLHAAAVWQARNLPLLPRTRRLRDVLQEHLQHLRHGYAFAHVRLHLCADLLQQDRCLYRGAQAAQLLQDLADLHSKAFSLPPGVQVRYQLRADSRLQAHQLGVQFGHALYLPGPQEPAQFQLALSLDRMHWQDCGPLWRDQRLCLLGAHADDNSLCSPLWPAAFGGSLLLLQEEGELQLQAEPAQVFQITQQGAREWLLQACGNRAGVEAGQVRSLWLQARQQHASVQTARQNAPRTPRATPAPAAASMPGPALAACKPAQTAPRQPCAAAAPASGSGPQALVWKLRDQAQACASPQALQLSVRTAQTDAPRTHSVARRPAASPDNGTGLAGLAGFSAHDAATILPQRQAGIPVLLRGLALPRLACYQHAGIAQLDLFFGPGMRLMSHGPGLLHLRVQADGALQAWQAGQCSVLSLPARLEPQAGAPLHLQAPPPAMQEQYSALLWLAQTPQQILRPGESLRFGRQQQGLAALRILQRAACTQAQQRCSAERIGLSRHAFDLRVQDGGFCVTRGAPEQALFVLQENGGHAQALAQEAQCAPGALLAVGPYILQLGQHSGNACKEAA